LRTLAKEAKEESDPENKNKKQQRYETYKGVVQPEGHTWHGKPHHAVEQIMCELDKIADHHAAVAGTMGRVRHQRGNKQQSTTILKTRQPTKLNSIKYPTSCYPLSNVQKEQSTKLQAINQTKSKLSLNVDVACAMRRRQGTINQTTSNNQPH
jgi:hypothetical protein